MAPNEMRRGDTHPYHVGQGKRKAIYKVSFTGTHPENLRRHREDPGAESLMSG